MTETSLMPCPFCGGEATKQFGFNVSQNLKGRIICSCGAEIRQGRNATEQEIIEKWNTRAERTCELDGTIKWDWDVCGPYWQHELSCGHVVTTTEPEPPKYCEECGARVVDR